MNKAWMWVVGVLVVGFLSLVLIGTWAIHSVNKDMHEIEEKREKQKSLTDGVEIYGKGTGEEVRIADGVYLWAHSVKTSRYGDLAVVPVAVKNTSETDFLYNKKHLYLEDIDGEQYPIRDLGEDGVESEIIVKPDTVSEEQEGFMIPDDYEGEYEGWLLVYDTGDERIETEVKTLWEDN